MNKLSNDYNFSVDLNFNLYSLLQAGNFLSHYRFIYNYIVTFHLM